VVWQQYSTPYLPVVKMFFDANGQRVINDQRDNILPIMNRHFFPFVLFLVASSLMLWYANPNLLIDILNLLIDIENAFMEYIRRFTFISSFDPDILATMCRLLVILVLFPLTVFFHLWSVKFFNDTENAIRELEMLHNVEPMPYYYRLLAHVLFWVFVGLMIWYVKL
jgi:hypothetical protein